MIIALIILGAVVTVVGIIWHARQHEESGESAMWWATRDIHEWWRR